ncbi:MAG: type II secretion system F family protein [Opitutales bacterium]
MAKFKYTAIDQKGKQKTGTVEAQNQEEANSKVNALGLMPTNVSPAGGSQPEATKEKKTKKGSGGGQQAGKKQLFAFGKVLSQEGLTIFTRQLSTLLTAGLPLLRALEVLIRQEENPRFKAVLQQIADQVKSGNTFSDGLAQHPKIFDRLYTNMVRAGEAGGVLDTVLGRLAGFMEKTQRTKKRVKSAMVYPIVVVSVAVVIVAVLMVFVVPKFQDIFRDMLEGAALPGPTQFVIDVSNFLRGNILLSIGLIAALIFGLKFLGRTGPGARIMNALAINLPKVGNLVRKVNIARITRTFGTLLSSGVPILQAINITRDITGNVYYAESLSRVHDSVRDGEPVSSPMERERIFPNMVTSMVDVGEETGELAEMLNRIADNYDEDVDNAVDGITSIIEPVMIVFLAVVVGFIVIALFLPIVEIINRLT